MTSRNSSHGVAAHFHVAGGFCLVQEKVQIVYEISDPKTVLAELRKDWALVMDRRKSQP